MHKKKLTKLIPYLMGVGYENAQTSEKEVFNPKFHRTPKEENLSFNFEMKYGYEVRKYTERFENLYREAYKTQDLSARIGLLQEAATSFEAARAFCYSKGNGGKIYFQDMWEYMHNSQNACYSYLDNINDSINEALLERDIIIPGIIRILTESPGFLQKNIYKEFPNISKSDVQRVIKRLEAEGIVQRLKKSNSYELYLVS